MTNRAATRRYLSAPGKVLWPLTLALAVLTIAAMVLFLVAVVVRPQGLNLDAVEPIPMILAAVTVVFTTSALPLSVGARALRRDERMPTRVWHVTRAAAPRVGDEFVLDPTFCRATSRMFRADRIALPTKASWVFCEEPTDDDRALNGQKGSRVMLELEPVVWPTKVYARGNVLAVTQPMRCRVVSVTRG